MVDLSIAMLNYQRVKLTMETKKLEVDMIQDFGVADHFLPFYQCSCQVPMATIKQEVCVGTQP